MAVKFSDFTSQAVDTALSRIVGFDSGINTQYTVAQLAAGILAADSGFTKGSVVFTGSGGVLSQDNANFFWDASPARLGIGTMEPSVSIETTGDIIVGDTKYIGRSSSTGPNIEFTDMEGEETPSTIKFRNSTAAIMTINSNTRVGIGTVDPTNALHVNFQEIQQKWSFDADSFATMYVADDSHTTLATAQSGNLILDAAGNITLDADSGVIKFQDGGADLANITTLRTESFIIACSDETTALTVGTKATFRMPYNFTLETVKASLTTAGTGANLVTVDINDSGTTILSTKITIDATEKTSKTALTQPVISDTSLASDAEITIDIDQIDSGGVSAGLKVTLVGYQTV